MSANVGTDTTVGTFEVAGHAPSTSTTSAVTSCRGASRPA